MNISSIVQGGYSRPWSSPQWLDQYSRFSASLKGLPAESPVLREAIARAFSRVYRAVAFDIDGTLTIGDGGLELDPELVELIRGLLIRGVRVALITGRGGDTSRAAAAALRGNPAITDPYMRRLFVIAHNGAVLFSTVGNRPDDFLRTEKPLDPSLPTAWQTDALRQIEGHLGGLGLAREDARVSKTTYALRMEFAEASVRDAARGWVRELIPDPSIHISGGQYGAAYTLDVVGTDKARALKRFADQIGVEPEGILRIGDAGAEGGNDFELLDSGSAFSVSQCSPSAGGCFPVLNAAADSQLVGQAATHQLLKLVLLQPPISVMAPIPSEALRRAAEFELAAKSRATEEFAMLTARVHRRTSLFLRHDARPVPGSAFRLTDLYDPRSGGVRLTDTELVTLDVAHPATVLFELHLLEQRLGKVPRLRRCMYTDSEVLLRGPDYYYAQVHAKGERRLGAYLALEGPFIEEAIVAVERLAQESVDLAKLKLTVAIFDNVRNILLNTLAGLCDSGVGGRAVIDFYSSFVLAHTHLHIELLLGTRLWDQLLAEYVKLLRGIGAECARLTNTSDAPIAEIPRYREADDFLLNVLAMEIAFLELYPRGGSGKAVLAVGIATGGNELPAIATVLATTDYGFDVEPALVLGLKTYSDRKIGDTVRHEPYDYAVPAVENHDVRVVAPEDCDLASMRAIICDDNCTTGQTLQAARDVLVVQGVDVIGAAVVRWPGFNRYIHQSLTHHGVVDHDLLLGFVRGLVAPNTYARLIVPGSSEKTLYEDQTGVFDKSKARIRRYLEKNGTPPDDDEPSS